MRSLAILVLLAFVTPSFADDRVDWSEYIETKQSKPLVIKHEAAPAPAAKKVAAKPAKKVAKKPRAKARRRRR
jgi:hypothetical protein